MNDLVTSAGQVFTPDRLLAVMRAIITLGAGLLLTRLASFGLARILENRMSAQDAMLLRRLSFYLLSGLVVATALHQVGFNLTVLLGAAGILTVALGFASQTSASNLISGLFLIAERPFVVGDYVVVEGVTGEVLSIDLLSVKLRTHDNLFVRVPNEQIIKSTVTTLTRFPIRRADLELGVAYKENLKGVKEILFKIADRNPICLDDPRPLLIFKGFGDSAIQFQFSVWAKRENFLELKNSIQEEIKSAFDEAGIEIPYPHRTLYAGSATGPLPIRVVDRTGTSG